jgi:hypothetical protein
MNTQVVDQPICTFMGQSAFPHPIQLPASPATSPQSAALHIQPLARRQINCPL